MSSAKPTVAAGGTLQAGGGKTGKQEGSKIALFSAELTEDDYLDAALNRAEDSNSGLTAGPAPLLVSQPIPAESKRPPPLQAGRTAAHAEPEPATATPGALIDKTGAMIEEARAALSSQPPGDEQILPGDTGGDSDDEDDPQGDRSDTRARTETGSGDENPPAAWADSKGKLPELRLGQRANPTTGRARSAVSHLSSHQVDELKDMVTQANKRADAAQKSAAEATTKLNDLTKQVSKMAKELTAIRALLQQQAPAALAPVASSSRMRTVTATPANPAGTAPQPTAQPVQQPGRRAASRF